jgi:hypothetical protein
MMGEVATLPTDGQEMTTAEIMERVLLAGDLSKLTADERTSYYMATCRSLGLNPYTKPFEYVKLSGREVLYATKGCADQLRANKRISLEITDRSISDGLFFVSVRGTAPDGRHDEDMGAVSVKNLTGEALANAMLKAVTKAKRRVTLSICGLNMPDESELEGLTDAPAEPPRRQVAPPAAKAIAAPPQDHQPAREPIRVQFPSGGQVEHPRTKAGLKMAMQTIADDPAALVLLNLPLLDNAASLPEWADFVADLRAKAAAALAPAEDAEPWPGAAAGAEQPVPDQDEPGAVEPDPAGDAMRAHKGEVPADAEPRDVFGLPPYQGGA